MESVAVPLRYIKLNMFYGKAWGVQRGGIKVIIYKSQVRYTQQKLLP